MAAKIINNVEDRSLGINHQLFFEELKKDKNKYLDILKEQIDVKHPIDIKNILPAIHKSYAIWKGMDIDNAKIIFDHLHLPSCLNQALIDFPNAKIIHLIRDPRFAIYSHYKFENKCYGYVPLRQTDTFLEKSCIAGWQLLKDPPPEINSNNYFLLKLEDLHLKREKIIRDIADWLGLKFEISLLESTICGMPWKGNSGLITSVNGFSNSLINRNIKKEVRFIDNLRIQTIFNGIMEKHGYKQIYKKNIVNLVIGWISIIMPLKFEFSINIFQIYKRTQLLSKQYSLTHIMIHSFPDKCRTIIIARFINQIKPIVDTMLIIFLTIKQITVDQIFYFFRRVILFYKFALSNIKAQG